MNQVFFDGVLREQWDDNTRTYTAHNAQGVKTSSRPYTPEENAAADELEAAELEQQRRETLQRNLFDGIAGLEAAKAAALSDVSIAQGLRSGTLGALADTTAQKNGVAAFVPSGTYQQGEMAAVRDVLVSIISRQEQILAALADWYAYRVGVDENAASTDDAIIFLARLESGRLSG